VTLDLTRRSLLKFMGGAVAGVVLSPMPWKLLDDASIWTQNWSRIARPPRGPISWRDTTCTLCPAGCGLRARLVGTSFVSAWPVSGHPRSAGLVCPLGLAAAQMRFHPARLRGAARREAARIDAPWLVVDADGAVTDLGRRLAVRRARGATDGLALLDLRPGRAMSQLYREFLDRQGGGLYLTLPDAWQASAAAFGGLIAASAVAGAPAPDLSRARSVLSFGAPLHDGWRGGFPAGDSENGHRPYLMQIDAAATATALRADRWLVARPGSEAPLALALAHVLVNETLNTDPRVAALADAPHGPAGSFRALLADFSPERVSRVTGLSPSALRDTARELANRRPALVVGVGDPGGGPLGAEEEAAVWSLNLLLGSVGPDGALGLLPATGIDFADGASPTATSLNDIPDGSLDLLLVDGSFPGAPVPRELLRRKLRGPDSLIVALSGFAGGAAALAADLVLPTPAPGEWTDDVPTPTLAAHASYAWSPPVAAPPDWAVHPAEWLARLETASGVTGNFTSGRARHEAELVRRAALLQSRGRGQVFDPRDGNTTGIANLVDPNALGSVLARGGCWLDTASLALDDRDLRLLGRDGELAARWRSLSGGRPGGSAGDGAEPLLLTIGGDLAVAAGSVMPPVLNKLYRESELHGGSRKAALNPATARRLGLADGAAAELRTEHGSRRVRILHDPSLPPDLVRLASGPGPLELGDPGEPETDILELGGASQRPVWRLTRVVLKEVRDVNA